MPHFFQNQILVDRSTNKYKILPIKYLANDTGGII